MWVLIMRSLSNSDYIRVLGVYETLKEAESKKFIWENEGPYESYYLIKKIEA